MPFVEARPCGTADLVPFSVPTDLEAHEPAEYRGTSRDDVRLLVTDPIHGARHARFDALADFLSPGDLLVLNDSMTFPAALHAKRETGEEILLHFAPLQSHGQADDARSDAALVEPRKSSVQPGDRFALPGGGRIVFIGLRRGSRRLWHAMIDVPLPYHAYFARFGKPIAYPHAKQDLQIDAYQTAYARVLGSSEMPSAGRPFTKAMFDRLSARGIEVAMVTLHAGVSSEERDELPIDEWRDVPLQTAAAVRRAKKHGSRIIAVGTTVVRALESSLDRMHRIIPSRGWTGLHITPNRPTCIITGLLTGFHEPASTHLAILEAVAGRRHVENAYAAALSECYLWHEFGDSHLLLSSRG
jgi:S-adenosylmethionine:tRNA ribosyltransferase-isomerase